MTTLIDLDAHTRRLGRPPTPAELRALLPPGYTLAPDHQHAQPDKRVFHRDSWVLLLGLISFGSVGLFLFYTTLPHTWSTLARVLTLISATLLAGGLVAPRITTALTRRR